MHRLLKLIICSLLVFSGFSCNVLNTDEDQTHYTKPIDFSSYNQDSTLIIGSWEWLRTTYYFTSNGKPTTETPSSSNTTKKLVIKENGTIEFYQNDELQEIKSSDSYLDNKLWGVLADTLAISTAHVDGPESVYLRSE